MQNPILIIVEGEADKRFVCQYVDSVFGIQLNDDDILITGGWTKLKSQPIINRMRQCIDNNGTNVVIFDADDSPEERRVDILNWGQEQGLAFELFLVPNNFEQGALEHLLEHAINPNNQAVFDCWGHYEDELKTVKIVGRNEPLTMPAKKTKIYGYLEVLLGTSKKEKEKIKEAKRDYKNKAHWDLDAQYLQPLRDFLAKVL